MKFPGFMYDRIQGEGKLLEIFQLIFYYIKNSFNYLFDNRNIKKNITNCNPKLFLLVSCFISLIE